MRITGEMANVPGRHYWIAAVVMDLLGVDGGYPGNGGFHIPADIRG